MADEMPENKGSSPDPGRPRRAGPTIDLEASEVSSETRNAAGGAPSEPMSGEPAAAPISEPVSAPIPGPISAPISSWVIAAVSGAVSASLVICVAWMLGWPAPVAPSAAPMVTATALDDLTARIAGIETRTSKPPAAVPDAAAAARADALEKSLAALRTELTGLRTQSEKLAASVNDVKAAPREAASSLDLSGINERIAQIERASRAQGAVIAQESAKIADSRIADAKPADDMPLRRIVAGTLLDVLVRIGDPYPAALKAAQSLTDNSDALKPLEGFAVTGVPTTNALCRELLTLVPKLSPQLPDNSTTGTGLVDKLQAGAAKLVRIERTDAVGSDRGAIVARVTAAALRNEFAEARRELKTLAPADRAAAQGWIEKADARDAALLASRQFAGEAMTALAKP